MSSIHGGTNLKLSYKNNILLILLLLILSLASTALIFHFCPSVSVFSTNDEEIRLKQEIETSYNLRNSSLISGNLNVLKPLFDTSQKYGVWSLEHEVRRVKYLKTWSKQRNITFTSIESFIRIKKIKHKDGKLRLSLEESYKFDYIYNTDSTKTLNSFGVGIRHTLSLINKNNTDRIYSDWYTDCFEDAMGAYSGDIGNGTVSIDYEKTTPVIASSSSITKRSYNREKAVAYADKFCGAAWGSGNNFKYNKKFNDYNGIGGDCTNFASQVIGEGGGLTPDGTWHCSGSKFTRCSGTRAWVNVDGLKGYLIYSGKARQIKKGTFKELTTPVPEYPLGIISKLKLGDLICYEKKGNPDHFAIITGFDSHGYPLVNSHTTDRYHVPWDLGWSDNKIKFILIHING